MNYAKKHQNLSISLSSDYKYIIVMIAVSFWITPVAFLNLPLNMEIVDFINILIIAIVVPLFLKKETHFHLPYLIPIFLFMLGGLIGTFRSLDDISSYLAILKGVYLFVWFTCLVNLFIRLDKDSLSFLLKMMLLAGLVHAVLIIAEFVFPQILAPIVGVRQGVTYRPRGLIPNPNMAASFHIVSTYAALFYMLISKQKIALSFVLAINLVALAVVASLGAIFALGGSAILTAMIFLASGHRSFLLKLGIQLLFFLAFMSVLAIPFTNNRVYETVFEYANRYGFNAQERKISVRQSILSQAQTIIQTENTLIVGIGPAMAPIYVGRIRGYDLELHNDLLASIVERGLIGFLGMILFFMSVIYRANNYSPSNDHENSIKFILLSFAICIFLQSLTHEVFNFRFIWAFLAISEAYLYTQDKHSLPYSN